MTPPPAQTVDLDATVEDMIDPVGAKEIAERLGVNARTVHMWKHRDQLPAPDYDRINGTAAWEWETVLRWAGLTGRLVTAELAAAYEELTGEPPTPPRKGGRLPGDVKDRLAQADRDR